jgi:hypothetical protein
LDRGCTKKIIGVEHTTHHHHQSCQNQTKDQSLPAAPIEKDRERPGTTYPASRGEMRRYIGYDIEYDIVYDIVYDMYL